MGLSAGRNGCAASPPSLTAIRLPTPAPRSSQTTSDVAGGLGAGRQLVERQRRREAQAAADQRRVLAVERDVAEDSWRFAWEGLRASMSSMPRSFSRSRAAGVTTARGGTLRRATPCELVFERGGGDQGLGEGDVGVAAERRRFWCSLTPALSRGEREVGLRSRRTTSRTIHSSWSGSSLTRLSSLNAEDAPPHGRRVAVEHLADELAVAGDDHHVADAGAEAVDGQLRLAVGRRAVGR